MPLYPWEDLNTNKIVEVIREYEEIDDEPTEEEAREGGLSDYEIKHASWRRNISKGITGIRGAGWNGKKGYW